MFLVPADAPGVSVGPKDAKMGQEGAWTADVSFDDVRVPAEAMVGDEVSGYRAAMTSLARGRVHIAALAVGTGDVGAGGLPNQGPPGRDPRVLVGDHRLD